MDIVLKACADSACRHGYSGCCSFCGRMTHCKDACHHENPEECPSIEEAIYCVKGETEE